MILPVKKTAIIYFAAALLLLLTLGVGIAIVYSDYIYTPNKGFTVMQVSSADPDFMAVSMGSADQETYDRVEEKTAAFVDALDQWAKENEASVLLRNVIPFYPHVSVSLHSDWGKQLVKDRITDEEYGLFIEKEKLSDPYMVKEGVFLPDQYAKKIEGTYETEDLPRALQKKGYYLLSMKQYKIPAGTPYMAQIFTDAEDIEGLRTLLKTHKIGSSNVKANETRPFTRLKSLFSPMDFYNLVLLLTLSAAIGGFIFLTFMQFRNEDAYRIRHLNGKPLYRIALEVMLTGLILFILSCGILFLALPEYCSYMTKYDIRMIRIWTGGVLLFTVIIAYASAAGRLLLRLRRR